MEGEKKGLNAELWLACAGPLVTLPAVGSRVVYFPQGHSEQVAASTQKEVDAHIPNYPNLPPQLICQLHNVTLHADLETDEVYAQMTLQPIPGQEKASFMTSDLGRPNKQPNEHFCKTLTASDTSTHGGFSIPRRAAEKVFPPLDFSQQPPAQEIIARDLHDVEWHFRHIYRGQPRRHLLTTGWSVFVSAKRLQAGDSVLFIRDEKNQILLGIRRANRQQPSAPSSFLSSDSMHIGVLAAAAHAHATSSRFTIFYNPRASPSEFVIPLSKYQKAIYGVQVSVGMRFRMQFETEDASTRRYTGTITGVGDLDPVRWPNSCWRSLKVGWDESTAGERQQRVSLWEIEPFTTPFLICSPSLSLRARRPRLPGEEEDMEANLRKATALWMRGENTQNMNLSMEHWMHLQQRSDIIASPHSEYYRTMAAAALQEIRNSDSSKQLLQVQNQQALQSQQMQFLTQYQQQLPPLIQQQQNMHQQQAQIQTRQHQHAHHHLSQNQLAQQTINSEPKSLDLPPLKGSGFVESEINSIAPPSMPVTPSIISRSQAPLEPERGHSHYPTVARQDNAVAEHSRLLSEAVQDPQISSAWFSIEREASQLENRPGSYPIPHSDLAGQNNLSNLPLHLFGVNIDSPLTSVSASISMNKQKDMPNQFSGGTLLGGAVCSSSNADLPINSSMVINSSIDDNGILQPSSDQQQYQAAVRTFTKVYKLGSVGRSLDITRLRNYEELKRELARMFGLEGQLEDPLTSIWQLVFIDNESDILLVGDDPWDEFVSCVRCIHIMSQSEVLQMNQKQMELLTTPIRRPAFGNCDNIGDLPGSMEQ